MTGAIFYASKYGSTAQYAQWIAEATGLPAFDIDNTEHTPSEFDFVVLGAPVLYHRLMNRRWVKRYLNEIGHKSVILFTTSGAPAGAKLDRWIGKSLPLELIDRMTHVALGGRQHPEELTRFDRMMLIIGGLFNPDRAAGREELHGFDTMDKAGIAPIVSLVQRWQAGLAM